MAWMLSKMTRRPGSGARSFGPAMGAMGGFSHYDSRTVLIGTMFVIKMVLIRSNSHLI
jgi:hypothetical protein